MTTNVDVANLAFQKLGTRTTITSLAENSNEAIQVNLCLEKRRDQLLRMAPWNCAFNFNLLTYITSQPGTPENATSTATTWSKGLPAPPWTYEYQYPVDCLAAVYVIAGLNTGLVEGIPIFPAGVGVWSPIYGGPAAKFKVGIDQFYGATAVASMVSGGTGYAAQDIITLETSASGLGAPAQVRVLTVDGSGTILTYELVNHVLGASPSISGSYFTLPSGTQTQGSTTGSGTGASFTLTMQNPQQSQRVILTNQPQAIMAYVKQITDPNLMDPNFIEAWAAIVGATVTMALSGDKQLANMLISEVNRAVVEARENDGNEGLTVNDVTPDWIRFRGWTDPNYEYSPNLGYDWGPLFNSLA